MTCTVKGLVGILRLGRDSAEKKGGDVVVVGPVGRVGNGKHVC